MVASRMVTLKEVARLAGVSTATASLALNGGPVNEATRTLVQQTAKRLSYVPNKVGRMLKTSRSQTVALLFMTSAEHPDIVHRTSLFYYLIEGILEVLEEAKYSLRLEVKSYEAPDLLDHFEQVVHGRTLDGIIIVPQFLRDYPFLPTLQSNNFPYVLLRPARFGPEVNYVDLENAVGGRLVANLFVRARHQKIAMINGPSNHLDAIERERGFREELALAGIGRITIKHGDFLIPTGYRLMEQILREMRPDAVFCANDYMAAGAIKCLSEHGLRVPQDVAVVGYDNNDICDGLVPSLTSIDHRLEELGSTLARELLGIIDGRCESVRKSISPRLVERGSHLH